MIFSKMIRMPFVSMRSIGFILLLSVFVLFASCRKEQPLSFQVAMASRMTAVPFYIISSISTKIQWDVIVEPDEAKRLDMLLNGEVQAIEWDVLRLYQRGISDEMPHTIGILPVNTPYALISNPKITSTRLTEKNQIVGIDYQGIRTFLLDYWLKGASKTRESAISDELRMQRLTEGEVQAVIVSEPSITQLSREGYVTLASTQGSGLVLGTLAVLSSTEKKLLRNVLLDYQQMLNQLDYIRKNPDRFLAKKLPHYNTDWLYYIPKTIYFSPQLFQEVNTWLHLNNPTFPSLSYEKVFWIPKDNEHDN